MTAQEARPKKRLTQSDKSKAVDLRLNKALTYQQIADILNTSKQTVHRNLAKLIPNQTTEIFKKHRADILSHAQVRVLSNVTDAKLKKASARDLIVSAGILYDKERLERGLATEITDYRAMILQVSATIERDRKLLETIEVEPEK